MRATRMTRKRCIVIAPKEVYPLNRPFILILFDTRVPGAERRLVEERRSWLGCTGLERLDHYHYVLALYAGGAKGLVT